MQLHHDRHPASSPPPAGIELFGEPEFPEIRVSGRVLHLDKVLSDATTGLIEQWLSLVRDAGDDDQAVLAGVRATAAIARELGFTARVTLSMRYPSDGDWFSLDARNPADP